MMAGANRTFPPDDSGLSEVFSVASDAPGFAFDCVGSPAIVDAAVKLFFGHKDT